MERILTPREEEVMQILWRLKKAFVKDILDELPIPKPPYNTVSSVVRKLEAEGLVGHRTFGNTHEYYPILKKSKYGQNMLGRMVSNYFSGSPESLLSHFVREEKIDPAVLKDLLDQINDEES